MLRESPRRPRSQRPGSLEVLALHPEPAERVDRLRREPEVSHDRDLGIEDRVHRVEALAAGCVGYLEKPFRVRELADQVRRYCGES